MPEIRTVLVLSTTHVTPFVANWLNAQGEIAAAHHRSPRTMPDLHIAAHTAGWTIYAHEPGEWIKPSTPHGVIEMLDRIFAYAREQGVDLINFDRDAGFIDDLPAYEW